MYLWTVYPSPQGRFLCSTIVIGSLLLLLLLLDDDDLVVVGTLVVRTMFGCLVASGFDFCCCFICWSAAVATSLLLWLFDAVDEPLLMARRNVSLDILVNALLASPPFDETSLPAVDVVDTVRCNVDRVSFFDGKIVDLLLDPPPPLFVLLLSTLSWRWPNGTLLRVAARFIVNGWDRLWWRGLEIIQRTTTDKLMITRCAHQNQLACKMPSYLISTNTKSELIIIAAK